MRVSWKGEKREIDLVRTRQQTINNYTPHGVKYRPTMTTALNMASDCPMKVELFEARPGHWVVVQCIFSSVQPPRHIIVRSLQVELKE